MNEKYIFTMPRDQAIKDAVETIEKAFKIGRAELLQALDAQCVKHGRWIKQDGFWNKNTVKCSLCGNYLDMNGVNGGRSDANFCPNCGAMMDKEE